MQIGPWIDFVEEFKDCGGVESIWYCRALSLQYWHSEITKRVWWTRISRSRLDLIDRMIYLIKYFYIMDEKFEDEEVV